MAPAKLLLDIDGVLNRVLPLTSMSTRRREVPEGMVARNIRGYGCVYDPRDGPALASLTDVVDLYWCTTWGASANVHWSPLLDLPPLPVVEVGFPRSARGIHWKRPAVEHAFPDERIAWIDDEFNRDDMDWAARRGHLLIRTDERTGLLSEHIAQVRAWALSPKEDHEGRWPQQRSGTSEGQRDAAAVGQRLAPPGGVPGPGSGAVLPGG